MKKVLIFSGQFWNWPFKVGIHYLTEYFIQEDYMVHFITVGNSCLTFLISLLGSGSRLRAKIALRFLLKGGTIAEEKILTSSLFSLYHPIKLYSPFLDKYIEFLQYRLFTKNFITFSYPRLHQLLTKTNFEDFDIVMLESGFATVLWDHIQNKRKIIYRISDDIEKLGYSNYFISLEEKIIRNADIVLAESKPIYEKAKKIKGDEKKIWQLPNGADIRLFSKTDTSFPIEYEDIKRPRAIFIGNTNIIDFDFLLQVVRLLPEVSFILIGPKPKLNKKYSNLYILGPIKKTLLPSYTKNADIGIIPFKSHQFSYMERPIKFYDYLASGLPIVSNFGNAQSMEPYAKLAYNVDDFIKAINESLSWSENDRKKHIHAAYQFSWDAIYKKFSQILSETMESSNIDEPEK